MALKGSDVDAKVRLLLALWELGTANPEVKRGDLNRKIVRKGEKSGDYQKFIDELEKKSAIAFVDVQKRKLTPQRDVVRDALLASLRSNFSFSAQVGKNTANTLLQLIREAGASPAAAQTPVDAIASYDAFKQAALETYDRLNRDYNLEDLVPIYRLRREMGDRVSRSDFNEWVLKMQTEDLFQLVGGEMLDLTPDKVEDSISTKLSGLRLYVQRLY
ncbi:hypothetical protein [Geitlerinema sp. PCC 7407]|uniref:hypothetical protein n=1 Tax=Geitlerinema sp. PCC 7407 TaxID=1173025 RepID=UPI00029FF012|nr:hypothetical protein [Geitlerinema sp. PCC 7407]AFY67925.1 hypothetical protein GEI7407_3458 [Geitlerinema sp. PCC 7407]